MENIDSLLLSWSLFELSGGIWLAVVITTHEVGETFMHNPCWLCVSHCPNARCSRRLEILGSSHRHRQTGHVPRQLLLFDSLEVSDTLTCG